MKLILAIVALTILAAPLPAEAANNVYKKWAFKTEEDIYSWNYSGMEEAMLQSNGIQFEVEDQAVMFRNLPEGFHRNVDALRVSYNPAELDEVSLLFLSFDTEGEIHRNFRITFPVIEDGGQTKYISLDSHRRDINRSGVFAFSFKGNSENVSVNSVEFLSYSTREKITGAWKSFWTMQNFEPFTINIMHGPVISVDEDSINDDENWHILSQSINSYLLVGLAIFGCALLFREAFRSGRKKETWETVKWRIIITFFSVIAAVWILYDLRMGAEFVRNVVRDHSEYVVAEDSEKQFRDLGNFHEFIVFAKPLLADHMQYEVFFKDKWPYYGILRYETYPARPNLDEPVSDTWLIYDRSDITIDDDGRLVLKGVPFTEPGVMLGRFDEKSFIYRASVLPSE